MKLRLTALSLAAGLAGLTALAQDKPPPAPPATPPPPAVPAAPGAPPPPSGTPGAPGLLPPPGNVPVEEPDSFKSEKDRQSYAVGWLFASRAKNGGGEGAPSPVTDEVLAGMKDVLAGGKSLDYAVGAMLAMQIRRAEVDVDNETLFAAVRDALANQPAKLSPQQQQMVLQRVQNDVSARMEAKKKVEQEKALKVSTEFLAANAKAEGVTSTPSGLQYKIEKPGDGKTATEGDIVTMSFKATLTDGTEVEKNPATGPARKTVRALPKGIQEGLTILKTGGKAKFWVPPALGYGEVGRQPLVKGNTVLIYDIELVSVEPLPKPPIGANANQPPRGPVTAVTPPITVEIPPRPGEKPAEPPKTPPPPGTNPTPPPPPPPAPVPPPAPPAPPK